MPTFSSALFIGLLVPSVAKRFSTYIYHVVVLKYINIQISIFSFLFKLTIIILKKYEGQKVKVD